MATSSDAVAPPDPAPCSLPAFKLERHFAKYEFTAPYLMCCSDCEALQMSAVLEMVDPETSEMWEKLSLGYTETAGLPALRQECCNQFFSSVDKDHIIILAPEEGVYLSMTALLKPGDIVVCMYPGYQSLYEIARSIGCQLVFWEPEWSVQSKLTFKVETLQAILKTLPKKPSMVVTNTPHNPTGFHFSASEWEGLLSTVKSVDCYFFSDEMYRLLELEPSHRLPAAADLYDKAISLTGMSKSFSLPGLRIGVIACKDTAFINRVQELKDWTTICSSAPSEVLALIALRSQHVIVDTNVAIIKANVEHFRRFVAHFSEAFEWEEPMASSVAYPRLLTGEPIDAFCDRVVDGCGVLLLPSTVYDHPPSAERGHFRIGLGRSNFSTCLEILWTFLESPLGLRTWKPES